MPVSPRNAVAVMWIEQAAKEMGITKDALENLERRAIKKAKRLFREWYGITEQDFNFEGRESLWEKL